MANLFVLILLSPAFATDCNQIYQDAYDLQINRQNGVMIEYDAETNLEIDMKNNVWQHPHFRSDDRKESRALLFARDWFIACDNGWYN